MESTSCAVRNCSRTFADLKSLFISSVVITFDDNQIALFHSQLLRSPSHVVFRFKLIFFTYLFRLFICTFLAPATTAESKEMTSLPTPPVHQFASDTQMEQLLDRKATETSRMPPDGHEFPVNRMANGVAEKHAKRFAKIYFYCFMLRRRVLLRWPKNN